MSAKNQTAKRTNNKSNTQRKGRPSSKNEPQKSHYKMSPRIKTILLLFSAIVFLIIIIFKGQSVFPYIRGFFFGVLGFGIFLLPILLIYLAVINEKERHIAHFGYKMFMSISIILIAGAIVYLLSGAPHNNENFFVCLGRLYLDNADTTAYMNFGCGLLGGLLGYPAFKLGGILVPFLILFALEITLIFIVANLSVKDVARAASRRFRRVKNARQQHIEKSTKGKQQSEKDYYSNYSDDYNSNESEDKKSRKKTSKIDIPLDDTGSKRKKKKQIEHDGISTDIVQNDEENAADKDLSEDLINIINRASKPLGEEGDTTVADIAEDISNEKKFKANTQEEASDEKAEKKNKSKKSKQSAESYGEEFENVGYSPAKENDDEQTSYHYPPIQLLSTPTRSNDKNGMEEMQNNAKKLIETLKSFGVNASIVNICRGPSVTRYELQPAPGVKISKITNLSDDIALNLAANGVRIEAPIPGKAAVGIEVPNKVVSMVSMRELIDSDEFRNSKSKLTMVLGKDISGEIVVADLAKMPHLLIAGTTGSGKSVCVNSILMSILFKASPDEVKLLLIDPKMVEFSKYKGIPHLLVPVVSDAKKAAGALAWAVNEMLTRYKIFSEFDCKDIDSYNTLVQKNLDYIAKTPPVENDEGEMIQPVMEVNGLPVAKEKMPRVVIAIDELADLMMAAPSEVEESICRLAQMARAAGMHLILATQRPTANVITGLIKTNVPSRISLKVSSNMDSRIILDTGGGEKLIGRGDMLFSPVGAPQPVRVQGCYASDEEIEGVTGYIKKSATAQYNAEIEEQIKKIAAEEIATGKKKGGDSEGDGSDIEIDSKMEEAIKCVIEAGQASTSLLQRRLKVGYARAGRMIDDMEQMGIVGPYQGSKPRDVLMTYNEWLERRNIIGNGE